MAIPSPLTADIAATHGLIARDEVLDSALEEVPMVREPGRERRTVVEHVRVFSLVRNECLFKNVICLP